MDTGCIPPTVNFFQYTSLCDWCLCFFDTLLFPLYPLFRTNRQHFGLKIFFREEKNIFSFLFVCGLFNCSYARELYHISAPFCLLSWGGSFSSGAVFLSNRLRKDFERFVCKEKRRTFVTAKAIPARLIEELFRRARRDLFRGRIRRRAFSWASALKKEPIDFADSEKGFTFAPTVRPMKGFDPEIGEGAVGARSLTLFIRRTKV